MEDYEPYLYLAGKKVTCMLLLYTCLIILFCYTNVMVLELEMASTHIA